jgi:tRNA uridine 5-carboxymethylaminomethyl modification enzyme
LREDNALDRLAHYGKKYGLYNNRELSLIDRQEKQLQEMIDYLRSTRFNGALIGQHYGLQTKRGSLSMADLICRPDFDPEHLLDLSDNGLGEKLSIFEKAVILIKYKGYLEKQDREIQRYKKNESTMIPEVVDYRRMKGLKAEAGEKFERFRPRTLGQASRIEGVTPSDVAVLTIHLKKRSQG